MEYNGIGQLKQKHLHGTNGSSFLQKTKYAYNERGWLKNSASNEFSFKLGYDTLSTPQYNGNISTQLWGSGNSYPNQFLYSYDKINRLTNGTSTGIAMSEVLSYDRMGNIASLNRDAAGAATYSYTGNRLNSISGGSLTTGAYSYDLNGNATVEGRTGVSLSYNYLNLPVTANKTGLSITYTYDAMGNKLKKVSTVSPAPTETTHYINGIQYKGNSIDFIQTAEGRALHNGGSFVYEYNLTDHLGNVRYSFDENGGAVRKLQSDDYYAFGLRKVVTAGTNKYLYNGKELQDELGQYDYGARFYDPIIGRFNTIDPLSEISRRNSPYSYALNNPIRFIDVDGMFAFEPTPEEAARMAKHVYGDKVELTGGWKVSSAGKGLTLNDKNTGFKSGVYERTVDGKTEYTYATAGTESLADWKNNATQLVGASAQYKQSVEVAKGLSSELQGAELTFTGHSLGGGLAEANSIATGDKAITFNAAGLSSFTKGGGKSNTDAYIMTSDPLNAYQAGQPLLNTAGGRKHYLQPRSLSGVVNGHSINSVIEALSTPTVGQQMFNKLKQALIPPKLY